MAKAKEKDFHFDHDAINAALDDAEDVTKVVDASKPSDRDLTISKRRRSGSWGGDDGLRTVTLVERDGVLNWRWGGVSTPGSTRRRRRGAGMPAGGEPVTQRRFELLEPDKINQALQNLDKRFTPDQGLRRFDGQKWVKQAPQAFKGRTLLFVHGTFSNNEMYLKELRETPQGKAMLGRLLVKPNYDQVLAFDHPTLAVSPVMNALELSRALAGSTHELDIIAHSRGGLVVRWWLEAFGQGIGKKPRAILAGSPIAGTSLAAGPRLRGAIDLLTNLGAAIERTMGLRGTDNPFLTAPAALIRIFATISSTIANVPIADTAVAAVPGLFGQAGIGNNPEIARLRDGPPVSRPEYFAIQSNFEPGEHGWRFWRHFRKNDIANRLADIVFEGQNDLVVDTDSMTDIGTKGLAISGNGHNFQTSSKVHHVNYFRQPETIEFIAKAYRIS